MKFNQIFFQRDWSAHFIQETMAVSYTHLSFRLIPLIFLIQCHPVILRMTHYKNLPSILCHDKKYTRFFRFCENHKSFVCPDFLNWNIRMSGMRCKKYVIKPAYKRNFPIQYFVVEYSKQFFFQDVYKRQVQHSHCFHLNYQYRQQVLLPPKIHSA